MRRQITATCAETHPEYPFCMWYKYNIKKRVSYWQNLCYPYYYWLDITGCEVINDSPSATLWQFNQEREITHYYGCHGKVTRIHFDRFGQKFGAGDTTGQLCLWKFDSHAQSNKPYYVRFFFFFFLKKE